MHQMNIDSLANGQKTWSNQAAELQVLRADHENRKKQGQGFFKMDEASITVTWEELETDIYELTTRHKEEIHKMLEEFDDQQIATLVELDAYEKECRRQEGEIEENKDADPDKEESGQTIPLNESCHEEQQGTEQEEAQSKQQMS